MAARKAKALEGNSGGESGVSGVETAAQAGNAGAVARIGEHRKRQCLTARMIKRFFGRYEASHPALLNQRTYLTLVGMVYERLVAGGMGLPLDELMDLAKVLSEGKRGAPAGADRVIVDADGKVVPAVGAAAGVCEAALDSGSGERSGGAGGEGSGAGGGARGLREALREVYGTG